VAVTEAVAEWRAVALRCRRRRDELGVTQQECADAAGMPSRVSYAEVESGARKLYAHELPGLARVLRVSPDWLLDMPTDLPADLAAAVRELSPNQLEMLTSYARFLLHKARAEAHR
jgi:transcriptional regulator with XRE-family HTH domain